MRHYDFPRTFCLIHILYFLCLQWLKVGDANYVDIKLDVTQKNVSTTEISRHHK